MSGFNDDNRGSGHYGAIITPSFAFGLDVTCKDCLWHIEGDRLMWSIGAQMVLYNTQTQEMRFIPLADRGTRALVLAVASNNKYFAVAERVPGMDLDQISVYAFGQDKRVKVLPNDPGVSRAESNRVECLHFSENSKYLLAQYGTPDWTLVVWRWYNGKILAAQRMESRPVLSSRFSSVDDLLLAVLTPTSLLQFRMDLDRETLNCVAAPPSWEPFALSSMCWIAGNMLAAVGTGGEVHVFQESTCRLSVKVNPLPRALAAAAEVTAAWAAASRSDDAAAAAAAAAAAEHLLAVTPRGRGFITAGTSGTVYFFEPPTVEQKRSGVRDLYVLVRRLAVDLPPPPDLSSGTGHFRPGHHRPAAVGPGLGLGSLNLPLPPGVNPLLSGARPLVLLSVSGADEEIVAVSAYGDVSLASMQLVLQREEKPIADVVGPELLEGEPFTRLMGGFLTGRVVGLAAAASQPLIAAASADDRQLRVWHYEARRCVAALILEDEPLGLDLHPGGQLLLLALPDKIKMYGIVTDALEPQFEVAMKRPTALRFSTGGAMFAYVGRTNAIHLHTTYHGQTQLAALKAHASAVNDLRFSTDDRMLVSVGAGGAVYFWDLATCSRVLDLDLVDKQALYCSVTVYHSEHGAAVVRASDGRMQQIYNGKVQYEVTCKGNTTAPSCLLGADKVLLAADDRGGVVSHAWPSDLPVRPGFAALAPPPHPYALHSAAGGGITRMALVPSRGLLFTACGDGTVLMSSVALVLDGILLESSPGGLHYSRGGRVGGSRYSSNASQRLLAGAGAGGGGAGAGSTTAAGAGAGSTAGSTAATVGSSSSTAPSVPYYITIPEERLLAVRDKALEVAQLVGNAKNDAEYQAFRAAQMLKDTITRLEGELEAARGQLAERAEEIERLQEANNQHERQVVKELEGAHMSAAEELEALYEKRLQVEQERLRVIAAARDDIRYKGEEELKRLRLAHDQEMQELRAHYEAQIALLEGRMVEAGEARNEQDRFFTEYIKQAEEDFEDHSERINKRVHLLAEAAEAREQKLKADNNILKRTNLRLKADKTIDMKRMDKLTADNAGLREQTDDLRLTISKLTKELEERDSVNADNYLTIQQLRRKVQELEKHKYVLSYKAEAYSKNLEPQREEIAALQDSLEGHRKELLSQAKRVQIMGRHVAEKDAALRTAKTTLADLKRRCELQDAAITAFSQELYAALQLPDDRSVQGKSARQKALDDLVRKYCLGDPRVSAQRDMAAEAIAAAAAAETRVVLLQWRLDQEVRTQRATQRIARGQNTQLLRELQVAQQDTRALKDRVDAAVVALRELQHRHAMLERRVGLKHSRGGQPGDGSGEEGLADGGSGEECDFEDDGISGGGGGPLVSLAGRVAPSRPASGAGTSSATGRPTPAAATNGLQRHRHGRPGTAGGGGGIGSARPPSAGFGLYRAGGPAGGGVTGVARGAPLKAFAELLVSERQRMQGLAAQLESGAAAVEQQQRALLGLRDQLAAAAAAESGDADEDGDFNDGGDGDGDCERGGLIDSRGFDGSFGADVIPGDGGEDGMLDQVPSFGRFARQADGASAVGGGLSGGGGGRAGEEVGSTAATGGSSHGDGVGVGVGSGSGNKRVPLASNGVSSSYGSGSGGGSGGGSPRPYHAPGFTGFSAAPAAAAAAAANSTSSSGGGATAASRFAQTARSRPLTASLDSASRRTPASRSANSLLTRDRPASSSAVSAQNRGSARSAAAPATAAATAAIPGRTVPGAVPIGGGGRAASPTPSGGGGGGSRLRPTSAAGIGLRAFTDQKVDRYRPPPPPPSHPDLSL